MTQIYNKLNLSTIYLQVNLVLKCNSFQIRLLAINATFVAYKILNPRPLM